MTMISPCFEGWTVTQLGTLIRPNGKIVPKTPNKVDGYLQVRVAGKLYYQHRIVFFICYGYWADEIDHKDRDRANNAPDNLRDISRSDNMHNTGRYCTNTSGVKGVSYRKDKGMWSAELRSKGIRRRKLFDTKQEAIAQRRLWEGDLS